MITAPGAVLHRAGRDMFFSEPNLTIREVAIVTAAEEEQEILEALRERILLSEPDPKLVLAQHEIRALNRAESARQWKELVHHRAAHPMDSALVYSANERDILFREYFAETEQVPQKLRVLLNNEIADDDESTMFLTPSHAFVSRWASLLTLWDLIVLPHENVVAVIRGPEIRTWYTEGLLTVERVLIWPVSA